MQSLNGQLVYSATDLVGFLECRHLFGLERAVAEGHLTRPARVDPVLDRIAQRGIEHERRFLARLPDHTTVVDIPSEIDPPSADRASDLLQRHAITVEAMQSGADVIYQAVLFDGRRLGYADFLRRVEVASDLGAWSYEVWDTKLARTARASAVLQLTMYSLLVEAIQGRCPERMHLALGGVEQRVASFRVTDFAAYYRHVVRDVEEQLSPPGTPVAATVPEPVGHCDFCAWNQTCRSQWRDNDDVSLVAGVTRQQRQRLRAAGVERRGDLAADPLALPRVDGVGREALARLQAQASIQVRGDQSTTTIAERIQPERDHDGALIPGRGLVSLPAPASGDLFFDIEGDPFFGSDEVDGIDYLFGVIEPGRLDASGVPTFHAFWSMDDGAEGHEVTTAAERRAFEGFIDLVMDRFTADPAMHVYHYAPYEPTAVKRLAGRYATREEEVDQLLRAGVFVDLYRVVRQGIRASVESYSPKRLEPLYGFCRSVDLRDAGSSIVEFETWLELGAGDRERAAALLAEITAYNRDDCLSTWQLRDWLEGERSALARELGEALPRPAAIPADEVQDSESQRAVQALVDALLEGLPDEMDMLGDAQRGRWLLGQLLWWYRREDKSSWWRYFLLRDELTDEERVEEPDALGHVTFVESWKDPAPRSRSQIYRFRYPPQDHRLRVGMKLQAVPGEGAGDVLAIDDEEHFVDLKAATRPPEATATSLIAHDFVPPAPEAREPSVARSLGDRTRDGCARPLPRDARLADAASAARRSTGRSAAAARWRDAAGRGRAVGHAVG